MLMVPLLVEDTTRMDWVRARYESQVTIKGSSADIRIRLEDAPELQYLLETQSASWVVDVRSPSTLYAKTHILQDPVGKVEFESADVDIDNTFVRTGIVALKDLQLPTSGMRQEVWGSEDLSVEEGMFLAIGLWHASRTLAQSLLVFTRDGSLPTGTMGPVSPSGEQFVVPLSQDIFNSSDRNIWMGGLIAVFAYLGRHRPPEEEDTVALTNIRNVLEDAGVPDWHDDGFDAARAATTLEQFDAPLVEDGSNDD